MKLADLLRKAQENGLRQGKYQYVIRCDGTRYCAIGAMLHECGVSDGTLEQMTNFANPIQAVRRHFQRFGVTLPHGVLQKIIRWNDDECKTFEDIITQLEKEQNDVTDR